LKTLVEELTGEKHGEEKTTEKELLSKGRILETLSSWDGEQPEEEADEEAVKLQRLLDEQELSTEQALLTRNGVNTSTPRKTALRYLTTKAKRKP